ncbi:hypothetical protein C8J57DRAFT_1625338 [Mycena rebaudengoi]|nr:hypothetical protein C8J57DRAFT_1625338 [Mycena rebaudengoi]
MIHDKEYSLEFQVLNAFTNRTFGGNPAAIVFLKEMLPDEVLEKIKDNFNQPIIVYISPPSSLTPKRMAAAEAIFRSSNFPEPINSLEFETRSGILTAQRVEDKVSMELPAGTTIAASENECRLVHGVFCRALGKSNVEIRYVGFGGPGFTNYLLVEVDVSEELGSWQPKAEHFREFEPRTQILVVTSASRQIGVSYETRMFAPAIGVPEDHVCGSAHCLNAPYWAGKRAYSNGHEQHAKAVSTRGGDIWSTYFEGRRDGDDAGRVRMKGNVKFTAAGKLDLTDIVKF